MAVMADVTRPAGSPPPAAADHDAPRVKVVDRRWWAREDAGGTAAEAPSQKPTYIEELERQLADKERVLQEYLAQHKQAVSEFEDVKLRMRREVNKEVERGRRLILDELLEVLDNLQRATAAARETRNLEALLHGLDMVERLFVNRFEGFGVRRIDALGVRFDPARHEAVTMAPAVSADQDDIVVGVIRPGYMIGDDVLRPAQVVVARFEPERGQH